MKAIYDLKTDTLTLELKPGPVAESDEDKPGVILDYDAEGKLGRHRDSRCLQAGGRGTPDGVPGRGLKGLVVLQLRGSGAQP